MLSWQKSSLVVKKGDQLSVGKDFSELKVSSAESFFENILRTASADSFLVGLGMTIMLVFQCSR